LSFYRLTRLFFFNALLTQWLKHEAQHEMQVLRMGLEAAAIVLFIAATHDGTSPTSSSDTSTGNNGTNNGDDDDGGGGGGANNNGNYNNQVVRRAVVHEDAIGAAITLYRSHLYKHMIPSLNETGHFLKASKMSTTATGSTRGSKGMLSPSAASPPLAKRRRSSAVHAKDDDGSSGGGDDVVEKSLKKVYPHVLATSHLQVVLMDRLEMLVRNVPLDDQQLVMLSSGSLQVLEIDGAATAASLRNDMQLRGTAIVTAAFGKYPDLRETILEDVFPILLRLPSKGKFLRCFPVRYASSATPMSLSALNAELIGPLLPSLNLVATSRPSHGSTSPQHSIQMFTFFLLSLFQSGVERPTYEVEQEQQEALVDGANRQLRSGLLSCKTMADIFVASLLKRCSATRKSSGGGRSSSASSSATTEFRPIFTNLVEDLLLVLIIPEYPASELLLSSIVERLTFDLAKVTKTASKRNGMRSPNANDNSPEATYLTMAFDILGKICSVQARVLAVHRERPIAINATIVENLHRLRKGEADNATDAQPKIRVGCFCGKKNKDVFVVECDDCKLWSHGNCVGVENSAVLNEWVCDACRLGRILRRERRKYSNAAGGGDANAFVDDAYAMRLSFLSSLAHRKGVADLEPAVKFHVARWADELEEKVMSLSASEASSSQGVTKPSRGMVEELLVNWGEEAKQPSGEPLTEEGSNRVILAHLAKTSPLFKSFRHLLSFIIGLMAQENLPAFRKMSVKMIEKTAEGDPQLILLPIITKAVSRRLTDQSISVREASASLVGAHVVKFPAAAKAFHPSLLKCLTDEGISVRKKAVRIFEEILTLNPRYKGRAEVCDRMLQRVADPKEEDSLRDLIQDVFSNLWLKDGEAIVGGDDGSSESPPSSPAGPNSPRDLRLAHVHGQNLVTPTPIPRTTKPRPRKEPQRRVDMAAEQMMEVVRSGGTSEHLETLVKQLLGATSHSDKGKKQKERLLRQELARKHCGEIVKSLFKLLVSIEEQRSSRGARVGQDLAATLQTIAVFAEVSPKAVIKNLYAILPYLKSDNGVEFEDETRIACAGCHIVSLLSPAFDHEELAGLARSSIAKDLTMITYKFGTAALSTSIRAFSELAHHRAGSEDSIARKKLLELAQSFYKYLVRNQGTDDFSSSSVSAKVRANIWRALTVLGFICRYYEKRHDASEWEDEIEGLNDDLPDSKAVTWSNLTVACYRLFSSYLKKIDAPTKCAALKALGGIFMAEPRLMFELEQVGLVDSVLAETADISLQIEALKCFQMILCTEEKRIDGGYARAKMDRDESITVEKRIAGDQDEDSNLFGGVLTSHSARLFTMTQSGNKAIRLAALELLGVLLRQGLVNPNEAIPYLFALQGDVDNAVIRSMALQMLMKEGDKRPDSLRQRVCLGVKKAYQFQKEVYHNKANVSALVPASNGQGTECIFDSIFKECMANIRKQRHGLFKNLLGLFELGDLEEDARSNKKKDRSIDLDLLSFVAQILAHLSYSSADNPLYIIHHITSMVTLQGEQILDRMADVLRTVGLSSDDRLDDANTGEDALETAANARFPSRTQEAQALNSPHFDLEEFTYLCRAGAAMALLLRLKLYLCRVYNLNETRCIEYDPTQKERLSDKGLSKVEFSKQFDSALAPGLLHDRVDKDALIRQVRCIVIVADYKKTRNVIA
jgi:cohesin loading factor subunit SCC2